MRYFYHYKCTDLVLDSSGNVVEKSDTTWRVDEEVNAIKIIGNGYTLEGNSELWISTRCFVNKDVNESCYFDISSVNNQQLIEKNLDKYPFTEDFLNKLMDVYIKRVDIENAEIIYEKRIS